MGATSLGCFVPRAGSNGLNTEIFSRELEVHVHSAIELRSSSARILWDTWLKGHGEGEPRGHDLGAIGISVVSKRKAQKARAFFLLILEGHHASPLLKGVPLETLAIYVTGCPLQCFKIEPDPGA